MQAFNEAAIARIFAHEVLSLLIDQDPISPESARKILSWHHTGFNVHSKVRTTTKQDAQRVARYMTKPILALSRLSFDETQGKVIYQYGKTDAERIEMDYLEFTAGVTAHIPDKGQVMIGYYGLSQMPTGVRRGNEVRLHRCYLCSSHLRQGKPPRAGENS